MTKVVIIDDEPLARSLVREYLSENEMTFEIVAECGDGFEGIKAIQQHKPDLVFLDIQMPRISGFEMLEVLETPPDIIFATAFDEYAVAAFERNAVDYLLKPFSRERFNEAISRWLKRGGRNVPATVLGNLIGTARDQNRIVVRNNNEISIVQVDDVVYIEAFDDYVKIFTSETYFLKKQTMVYYERLLEQGDFLRVHRSFIINLKHLLRIEPMRKDSYVALLKGGKRIPLSRTGYGRLRERLA